MNGRMVQIVASGGWDVGLSANPDRTYILVSGDTGGIIMYWFGLNTPPSLIGVALNTAVPWGEISVERIGALITQQFSVKGVAGKTITIIEGFK